MKYATLIDAVGERSGATSSDEARRASEAVLAAFAGALAEPDRRRLADVLPTQLHGAVEHPAERHADGGGALVRTVAQRAGCPEERARYYAQAVLSTLRDAEPGLIDEITERVPGADDLMQPVGQGMAPRGAAVPTEEKPRLLDADEIERALAAMPGWTGDQHRLSRTVGIPADRTRPLLTAVRRAEDDLHHNATVEEEPDGITFHVWTHSLGRVTDMDLELARRIDDAVAAVGSGG
jgi:pterin-4a-carbinolamine dehydratase/uncharacterized protein (DUF2267 family)